MNLTFIIIAAGVIGAIGLFIGLFLGFSEKIFHIDVDQKELDIRECLPGNNCGGCGFASCDDLAKKIACGIASPSTCPVGGDVAAEKISAILGVKSEKTAKKVAVVKCMGTCDKTENKYNYFGSCDCNRAVMAPGRSAKACSTGCLGYGSCEKACDFDAIMIINGVCTVVRENCKGCGKCVEACPNNLIELVPEIAEFVVKCSSNEKGKAVKSACETGCIGCGICVKLCPNGAINIQNNLAVIDYDKCNGCGVCATKCPSKIIIKQYD